MKRGELDWYGELWDKAQLALDDTSTANISHARLVALQNRSTYQAVEEHTGVPWYVVAAIHIRECNGDFTRALCNGQKIIGTAEKTTIDPIGRGPYATWLESAVDALDISHLDEVNDWTIENILKTCERYNGLGYLLYHPSVLTPYLWSCTNLYSSGLYTSDGNFDPRAKDLSCGVAATLKVLQSVVRYQRYED